MRRDLVKDALRRRLPRFFHLLLRKELADASFQLPTLDWNNTRLFRPPFGGAAKLFLANQHRRSEGDKGARVKNGEELENESR
mmetsp:Transcript_30832/g.56466  ORF Transcript_30832/g.56466 Transcript_30832/m.56466 type:complete len:83 (+) Transcript_30832:3479-3727(+)